MQTELYAVIVAGGSGQRMGSKVPKQFLEIKGKPILWYTLRAFADFSNIHILLVLPESSQLAWEALRQQLVDMPDHKVISGGSTRFESVKLGLSHVPDGCIVMVHDGVRPIVDKALIERTIQSALTYGSGIAAIDLTDSIREIISDEASRHVNRSQFKLIQTPQTFGSTAIKKAYAQPYSAIFTDDASVAEAAGIKIHLTEGSRQNIKITTPIDLLLAEQMLSDKTEN